MSLDQSVYQVLIHDMSGRNPDQWMSIEQLNALISSEEDMRLRNVEAKADESLELLQTPGVPSKIASIGSRTDSMYEFIENKVVSSMYLNDPNIARAKFEIPLADTVGVLTVMAVEPGDAGNSYTMRIVQGSTEVAPEVGYDDGDFLISIGTTTTCYELARALLADETITSLFTVSYLEADSAKLVEEVNPAESFTSGADGYVMTSSGQEIDTAVSIAAEDGKPDMQQVAAVGKTGEGENWEITWTAEDVGAGGNDISITIINGTGNSQPIKVNTTDTDIVIELATDETGEPDDVVNTATAVATAVNEDAEAGALVQGALTGSGGVAAIESKTNLSGGVDITTAPTGKIRFDSTALYISIAPSTATESSWKSITFDAE